MPPAPRFSRPAPPGRCPTGPGTLLAHLRGTHAILRRWNASPEVCDAGLFHSIYGTESYGAAALALEARHELREVIGSRAERLAFLFGVMKKAEFYERVRGTRTAPTLVSRLDGRDLDVSADVFIDLCHVFTANWLEQRPRAAAEHQDLRRTEFAAMCALLSEAAREELVRAYGFSFEETTSL